MRNVPGVKSIRATGAITFFVALVTLVLDSVCYAYFTNVKYGMWWASVVVLLATSFTLRKPSRCAVITACVLSSIGVLLCTIGCSSDNAARDKVSGMKTCVSQPTNTTEFFRDTFDVSNFKFDGNSKYVEEAVNCYMSRYEKGDAISFNCFCADKLGQCFIVSGTNDCRGVIGVYKMNLEVAAAFDIITLFCVFVFAVLTCCSLCCPSYLGHGDHDILQLHQQADEGIGLGDLATFEYEMNPQQQ